MTNEDMNSIRKGRRRRKKKEAKSERTKQKEN